MTEPSPPSHAASVTAHSQYPHHRPDSIADGGIPHSNGVLLQDVPLTESYSYGPFFRALFIGLNTLILLILGAILYAFTLSEHTTHKLNTLNPKAAAPIFDLPPYTPPSLTSSYPAPILLPPQGSPVIGLALTNVGLSTHLTKAAFAIEGSEHLTWVISPYADQFNAPNDAELWLEIPIEDTAAAHNDPGPLAFLGSATLEKNRQRLTKLLQKHDTSKLTGVFAKIDDTFKHRDTQLKALFSSLISTNLALLSDPEGPHPALASTAILKTAPLLQALNTIPTHNPADAIYTLTEHALKHPPHTAIGLIPLSRESLTWLPNLLKSLKKQGYTVLPLSQLYTYKNKTISP